MNKRIARLGLASALTGLLLTGCGGDDDAATDEAKFCEAWDELDGLLESASNETLEDIQENTRALSDKADEVAAAAPEEIRSSAAAMRDTLEEITEVIDSSSTIEEAQEGSRELFTDDSMEAEADKVEAYFEENCAQAG